MNHEQSASSFLDSNRNDRFSEFRGVDLQELLVEIENFYLDYRETLHLPTDVSFGVEIEYERLSRKAVQKYIAKNLPTWLSKEDISVSTGGEINSRILHDDLASWKELRLVCEYLKRKHPNTEYKAGGHIHIGAHILKNTEDWKDFLLLYIAYEDILTRFLYGDKINARKTIQIFAPPIRDMLYNNLQDIINAPNIYGIKSNVPWNLQYFAISFNNVQWAAVGTGFDARIKNTLEFRSPNATIEEVVLQNNIHALSKCVLVANQRNVDREFLIYKLEHEKLLSSENEYALYDVVNLKNALEFVDCVFDNNLDKVYFLRQYIKDFQEKRKSNIAIKSKRFIK